MANVIGHTGGATIITTAIGGGADVDFFYNRNLTALQASETIRGFRLLLASFDGHADLPAMQAFHASADKLVLTTLAQVVGQHKRGQIVRIID